ncbi:hypothetical protein C1645_833142, partial [Glomus cerebriforme]
NKKSNQCLEFLYSRIKSLEEKIEHDNVIDDRFIKLIVKEVVKTTFNLNIYPSKDELQEETEEYLKLHYQEFMIILLLAKQRSLCSFLSNKAKKVLFTHFGATVLPQINTNSTAEKITAWKANPKVTECYNNLFNREKNFTFTQILEKVFASEMPPFLHIAFVATTFTVLLDLKFKTISTNEDVMKN